MKQLPETQKEDGQAAFSRILTEYRPLIESMVVRFSGIGYEEEDLRQEAIIALLCAFHSYDPNRANTTFGLYAKVCIRNRMISLARKGQVTWEVLSEEDAQGIPSDAVGPEEGLIEQESYLELLELIQTRLTEMEKQVLTLYLRQARYAQIAQALGISEKAVGNAIYRVKNKLKKHGTFQT